MITFLTGLQGGFTRYPCFLYLWDSKNTEAHYKKDLPARSQRVVGQHNVKWEPLVSEDKVLMPPLHIKLGLIKQFVKALYPQSSAFKKVVDMFPKLSDAKIKAGIFVGPQVRRLLESEEFVMCLSRKYRIAWESFR